MYFNEAKQRYVISIRIFRAINCLFWQDLEKRIADVLRQAFAQCPTIDAQLRLLEVFEGISARELVQVRAGSLSGMHLPFAINAKTTVVRNKLLF